jgi:hypothetical protein
VKEIEVRDWLANFSISRDSMDFLFILEIPPASFKDFYLMTYPEFACLGTSLFHSFLGALLLFCKKNKRIHEIPCAFCWLDSEDQEHEFFNSGFTRQVWGAIFNWMGINSIPFEVS